MYMANFLTVEYNMNSIIKGPKKTKDFIKLVSLRNHKGNVTREELMVLIAMTHLGSRGFTWSLAS